MRTILGMIFAISLCIQTIPLDEWGLLSKTEKMDRLKQSVEAIKQELQCPDPHIQLDIDKQFLYVMGECDNGKFIAKGSVYDKTM